MAEGNNNQDQDKDTNNNNNDNGLENNNNNDKSKDQDISKLVEAQVAERLKDIKSKLDNAYASRDEALKKIAEFERQQKEAEIARLKEEGKHKEAYEREVAEEKAKREAAEKRITELTRDVNVRSALNGLDFRNEKAADIAFKEVISELVQNEKGEWVHKTGISIKEYVEKFAADEEQSFLFKPKVNSGSGSSEGKGGKQSSTKKSLFEMSQAEVLKLASEGKL